MENFLTICVFSFLGTTLRFFITIYFNSIKPPIGTLICNSLACVLMGTSLAVLISFSHSIQIMQNIAYAFLSALSTFSTFSHDTYLLLTQKGIFPALTNILLNLLAGFFLFALSFFTGMLLI